METVDRNMPVADAPQKGNSASITISIQCVRKKVTNVEITEGFSMDDLFIDSVESRISNGQVLLKWRLVR